MPGGTNSDFRLEDWLVQPAQCRLSKDGQTRQVRPKVMDLLTYFATHRGEVVSKDQLLDGVWGSEAVSESALTRTVTELRHALGDDADAPRMLGTIPKRGYRWIGSVTVVASDVVATIASRPSRRTKAKNWLAVGGSAAVLIGAFVAWMWARAPVRIAVLPFDRTIDDPDRQDTADGLAEDIIMSLHTADPTRLLVLGGASTLRYKGTTKSFTAIGHELGVDYLVKAIVWTDGPRLRLTANLIRVRDQRTVWVQSYERDATGILGLQLEVSSAIAEHIVGRISSGTRASIERRHTRDGAAYKHDLMGRTLWLQRKPPATQQALVHYDRAIALAPDYALAWSGIADARGASPINGDADPRVVKPAVRRAVMEALRAEPELAEVQTSQGVLNFWLEWNWPEAEHALRHALALDPEYPFAHQVLANVLSHSGRHREALDEMRKARELDPLDPILFAISSQVAFHAKDYARATEHARDALRIDPDRAYAAGAGAG